MTFGQSVLTALFCMTVVFAVLIILNIFVRIFSTLIGFVERKKLNTD